MNSASIQSGKGGKPMTTYAYRQALEQIEHLTPDEQRQLWQDLTALLSGHHYQSTDEGKQLQLLEDVIAILRGKTSPAPEEPLHDITEFRGIGKELWSKINVQEYLDQERNSWDG
jgi:hypothetical protein